MRKILWWLACAVLLVFAVPGQGHAFNRSRWIPNDFVLFWAAPTRAYPNVPLDFRFVAYESSNQALRWQLSNAPAGMIINQDGRINWTPTPAQVGTYTVTVSVKRESGDERSKTFTIRVGTDDFLFVSLSGNDSNPGTIDRPVRTFRAALSRVPGGDGKTIYFRGGTYRDNVSQEDYYVGGRQFSEGDPLEIRSFPGEWAAIDREVKFTGLFVDGSSYVIISDLEVHHAGLSPVLSTNIGIQGSSFVVVRDSVAHHNGAGEANNPHGFYAKGTHEVVFDGNLSYQNGGRDTPHTNNANYLFFTTGTPADVVYSLNNESWGNASGYKVKHSYDGTLIIHKCRSYGDNFGYHVNGPGVSVRYSVSLDSFHGIYNGTDGGTGADGAALYENNTIINAIRSGIFVNGSRRPTISIRNNLIVNTLQASHGGEDDYRMMEFWFREVNPTYPFFVENNTFLSPSQDNIIRFGAEGSNYNFSYSRWKSEKESSARFGDPGFADISQGVVTTSNSGLLSLGGGEYVGAARPGALVPRMSNRTSLARPVAPEGVTAVQVSQ